MFIKILILLCFLSANHGLSKTMYESVIYDSSKNETKTDSTFEAGDFTIPEGLTAKDIIKNFVEAIGGEEKIYNIVDRTTIMRGTVQGINVTMLIYQKAPNKLKQQIKAGANEQIIIFDGEKGVMSMGGEKQEITGSELEKLKLESNVALLADPEHYGLSLSLEGAEDIDGIKTYKVIMTLPSGIKWTQYYNTDTFLKVKESKYVKSPMGLFEQNIYYDDYQEVDGMKFPFKIKQSIGTQSMEFTVSSVKINSGLTDREFEIE
jgi:outer membrane lipoprotein-sorting protein